MTDIVVRLLKRSQWLWTTEQQLSDNNLVKEAADEIELLRDVIKSLREKRTEVFPQMVREPDLLSILEVQVRALEVALDAQTSINKHFIEENERLRAELQAKERHRYVEFGDG